jgi:hypothetical protein
MKFTPFAFVGNEYPVLNIDYLIVGGGGAGGNFGGAFLHKAGDGGAGGFISASATLVLNPQVTPTYSIVVGRGGTGNTSALDLPGNNGSSSIFLNQIAYGGGAGGGSQIGNLSGLDGASGGGAGYFSDTAAGGGAAIYGNQGFNGAASFYSATPSPIGTRRSGAGGGASSAATANTVPSGSIPGLPKAWLDGFQYAGGGGASYQSLSGSGGNANTSYFSQDGISGIVKLRYTGSTALFAGGDISISGGYVYHAFSTSGTLTLL